MSSLSGLSPTRHHREREKDEFDGLQRSITCARLVVLKRVGAGKDRDREERKGEDLTHSLSSSLQASAGRRRLPQSRPESSRRLL